MSNKVRVYDLAKELGLTNKELIDVLEAEGLPVKSHSSSLEGEFADLIRDRVFSERRAKGVGAKVAAAAAAVAAAPVAKPEPEPVLSDKSAIIAARLARPAQSATTPAAGASLSATNAMLAAAQQAAKARQASAPKVTEIHLKAPIVIRDLAEALGRKPNELIGMLMGMNVFATINQVIDVEVAEKVCAKHGVTFIRERRERPAKAKAKGEGELPPGEENERKVPRPPVIAFLGHVDHGKTSLQDAIRETHVAKGERGGITQGIGASVVSWHGQLITMLDTPGHEAFTAMRARGASTTDIVVLVVAADDGVMPQTIEAINHARAAKVPIVVALNKVDLPGVNFDRILVGLQQNGINAEEWGGDVGVVRVSAHTKQGLDELLERILLESEIMELKGNPELPVRGVVIEAQLETGMGPTAHALIRNGTLHVGDAVVCGKCYGKVKAMVDYTGQRIKAAGPSTPVKIMGLTGVPEAGDQIEYFVDEREAKAVAEERQMQSRAGGLQVARHATLEDLFQQLKDDSRAELKIIIKADVRGSIEAIVDALAKVQSEKIKLNIVNTGVGEITENDVSLAGTSDAILIGFHVRAMPGVNAAARREKVEIRLYGIIYELLDDVQNAMLGKLEPEIRESVAGTAEIIRIFEMSKYGKVCGCAVREGTVRVGANARVKRGADLIYKGRIQSLRRFQEDVREVKNGLECGIRLDNFEDFAVGDVVEVINVEKIAATL